MTDQPAAEPTPDRWFVRECPHAYGDIEVVLGDDFTIYIPLKAIDWNDAKRWRMKNHAKLIAAAPATAAERDRLVKVNEGLVKALEALLRETELAGNANADDYGWPTVIPQARAALDEARKL